MKHFKLIPLVCISIFCLVLLVASLQPGQLDSLGAVDFGFVWFIGLLLIVGIITFFSSDRKTKFRSVVILLLTIFLLHFNIPQKVGFAFSYLEFQKAVTASYNLEGQKIGLYKIIATSSNLESSAGIHFLTFSYFDSATSNYGFAYKPNLNNQKNPFGAYRYDRIFGDWYIFKGATC